MNMSVFVGESVLDLSKTFMYKFYYDYMILKWGKKQCSSSLCRYWQYYTISKNMIFMKILFLIIKTSFTYGIMMKEEEKDHYPQEKNKSNWLDER